MRKQRNQSVEGEALSGELITGPQEYVLKKAITYKGVPKQVGDSVKLNDRQATWLKGSEHI